MSSSDSDSSDSSSDVSTAWPWQVGGVKPHISDDSDSSSEDSSEPEEEEEIIDDSWTNRRNIFISVFNTTNYKDTTLITNYNELHTYRDKYNKLSKKTPDNIKNVWSEVKVNVPELGIVPLKSYEKELIDTKKKLKAVKKLTSTSTQSENTIDKNKITVTARKILTVNKNNKENVEIPTQVAKATEGNKNTPVNGIINKPAKQDKGIKVDLAVLNVTKSESDKKNTKTKSTDVIVKHNETDKNAKNNSSKLEFKKPQTKSNSKNNKISKDNSKEVISEKNSKKRKQKQKNSNSQSSENSDMQRSSSVDSRTSVKEKAKKKTEESNDDSIDDTDDEDEEIIDNMDALTGGNSKVIDSEMLKLVKHKEKKKTVETPKVVEKKVNEKNNQEQNVTPVNTLVTPVDDDLDTFSEKHYIMNSERYAEDSVDMLMENNLTGAMERLDDALQFNPGDDRHYLNRCYCHLLMNKPSLAIADAQYVLQTSSHYGHRFIAYLRAGRASMALKKYTQAENFLKDSLSINSDNLYAQREYMRAKILRIASLGYTERNAVLALLKYSKTSEAISYLANKKFANNQEKSDSCSNNFDDTDDLNDVYYSSDEDEKPNCTTLINNMLNHEPGVTKFFHILAKPINFTTSTPATSVKDANGDSKKKNTTNNKANTVQIMDRAIWVGSLTKNMTEAVLKKKFKQYGNIVSIYCPPNESYAFVNFEKSEHVENVLKNPYAYEINGHKVVIRQGVHRK